MRPFLLLLPLALVPLSLAAQDNTYRAGSGNSRDVQVVVTQHPDARELARSWVSAFEALEKSNRIRLSVVRGDTKISYDRVLRLEAADRLVIATIANDSRGGRLRVVVRADEIIELSETPE